MLHKKAAYCKPVSQEEGGILLWSLHQSTALILTFKPNKFSFLPELCLILMFDQNHKEQTRTYIQFVYIPRTEIVESHFFIERIMFFFTLHTCQDDVICPVGRLCWEIWMWKELENTDRYNNQIFSEKTDTLF